MRGKLLGVSAVAAMVACSIATAGTIDLYFSAAQLSPNNCTITATYENPTLYLAPSDQVANIEAAFSLPAGTVNFHKGYMNQYMDVAKRSTPAGTGCGNETVAALGQDIYGTIDTTQGRLTVPLTASGFLVYTLAADTGSAQDPWSAGSPNTPTLSTISGSGTLVADSRAVAVPESNASTLWNGYCPNTGNPSYKTAKLSLQAGAFPSGPYTLGNQIEGKYSLRMRVGNLKITRVYRPGTGSAAPEDVSFGRNGGSPDATVTGNVVGNGGSNFGVEDATVIIRKKGDFGYFDPNVGFVSIPDGSVANEDLTVIVNEVGSTNPQTVFIGDFGYFDPNIGFIWTPDCVISNDDLAVVVNVVGT